MAVRLVHGKWGMGWQPDLPDQRDLSAQQLVSPVALPPNVDLRPVVPEPYDQGELGSCTANGLGAAYEFDLRKQGKPEWRPSRLFVYYNERAMEGTVESDSGAMIRDGAKSLRNLGACPEDLWPYDISRFRETPPKPAFDTALEHKTVEYRRVAKDTRTLQTALASGFPVVFGFTVYASFESSGVTRTGVVPMPSNTEEVLGGHCVVLCGYLYLPHKRTLYGVCLNSWSRHWGDAGYFYMPMQYICSSNASDFWVIRSVA